MRARQKLLEGKSLGWWAGRLKTVEQAPDTIYSPAIAAGNDTEIQVNVGGIFGTDPLFVYDYTNDRLGVGIAAPDVTGHFLSTTEQLRLGYDADSYCSFTVQSDSDLLVVPAETGRVMFQPTTDSTTFFQILDAGGGTSVFNVDSDNERVGVCNDAPATALDVTGTITVSAGVTFSGASGANNLTFPDNTAIAGEFLDAGGLEYARINSTDANPYLCLFPAGGGLVSVGHATPLVGVHIKGAGTGALRLEEGTANKYTTLSQLDNDADFVISRFGTGGNDIGITNAGVCYLGMRGNAGVGTATPTLGLLQVDGNIAIGGSNNELRFYEAANYIGFEAPALAADQIWVLPAVDGNANEVLLTDGGGNLSFGEVALTVLTNYAEGSLIIGGGADWETLTEPGAAGYALVSDGTTFAWSQTPTWTGDHTWTSGNADSPVLTLTTTDAGVTSPKIAFYKDSATPADDDKLGIIHFYGETSTGAKDCYAYIVGQSLDVTNGDTVGGLVFSVLVRASERNMIAIRGNNLDTDRGEIVFNEDGYGDVDIRFEANGIADAFQVQGSDGQVTLGVLGVGW